MLHLLLSNSATNIGPDSRLPCTWLLLSICKVRDKCKELKIFQSLIVVICTHLRGYILVNDYTRCTGEENLTPFKIYLSPELGLIVQRSQDVSAFLGACALGKGCMADRGSTGSNTEMVFDSVLSDRAHYEESNKTWKERFQCSLFGMSSAISAPSVI